MLANYHTHTVRCRHASGEDREYVEKAIEAGLKILGFSDHCPWVFPDDFVSGIRLSAKEVDGYFSSLESLKKEYAKDIKIYIGFEAEYLPEMMEAQDKLLKEYPLDYMILGQHFLDKEQGGIYSGQMTTDESILKRYIDIVIEAMNTGKYLYVAHPDVIHYVGSEEIYEKHMKRFCSYLKEKDVPIEINLLGIWTNRHYPSNRFLKIAGEVGNSAIIGIDAHSPDAILNYEAVRRGEALCQQFHLPIVDKDFLSVKK